MPVVLLSNDLAVLSRVEGPVANRGDSIRVASAPLQAVEYCRDEMVDVLIIDLTLPSIDIDSMIAQLRTNETSRPRVIAFGPHVHEQRLEKARQAGCDEVVSRGQFFAQIDAILENSGIRKTQETD
jgi:CheY-like chemotaxis protein